MGQKALVLFHVVAHVLLLVSLVGHAPWLWLFLDTFYANFALNNAEEISEFITCPWKKNDQNVEVRTSFTGLKMDSSLPFLLNSFTATGDNNRLLQTV